MGVKAALEPRQRGRRHARVKEHAAFRALDPSQVLHHLLPGAHIVGDRTESRLSADSGLPHAIGPVPVTLKVVALHALSSRRAFMMAGISAGSAFRRLIQTVASTFETLSQSWTVWAPGVDDRDWLTIAQSGGNVSSRPVRL